MKFTVVAVLLISFSSFVFSQESNLPLALQPNTKSSRTITVSVYKPIDLAIHLHVNSYGILGPEGFFSAISFTVSDAFHRSNIGNQITLTLSDVEINLLNSIPSKCIQLTLQQTEGLFAYQFVRGTSCICTESEMPETTKTFQLSDQPNLFSNNIYPPSLTVKGQFSERIYTMENPSSAYSICWFPINESNMEYQTVSILDSTAIALYGSTIRVKRAERFEIVPGKPYKLVLEKVIETNSFPSNGLPLYILKSAEAVSETN